jgi:hypothetical protein
MTLSDFERRWLLVVFETVLPTREASRLPASVASAPMDRFVDDLVRRAPAHFVLGLRACLWILMLAPPFVLGRLCTFVSLPFAERLALLDKLGTSESYVIREMPLLFKTVACLGVCGLPEVQKSIGIQPTDAVPPEWARRGLPVVGS